MARKALVGLALSILLINAAYAVPAVLLSSSITSGSTATRVDDVSFVSWVTETATATRIVDVWITGTSTSTSASSKPSPTTSSTPSLPADDTAFEIPELPEQVIKSSGSAHCRDWTLPDSDWTWAEDELDTCPVPTPSVCTIKWLFSQREKTFNPRCADVFYARHPCNDEGNQLILDSSRNYCAHGGKYPGKKAGLSMQIAINHANFPVRGGDGSPAEPDQDGVSYQIDTPLIRHHKIVRPYLRLPDYWDPSCPMFRQAQFPADDDWKPVYTTFTVPGLGNRMCYLPSPKVCVPEDKGNAVPVWCQDLELRHWKGICPYGKVDGTEQCKPWWEKTRSGDGDVTFDWGLWGESDMQAVANGSFAQPFAPQCPPGMDCTGLW